MCPSPSVTVDSRVSSGGRPTSYTVSSSRNRVRPTVSFSRITTLSVSFCSLCIHRAPCPLHPPSTTFLGYRTHPLRYQSIGVVSHSPTSTGGRPATGISGRPSTVTRVYGTSSCRPSPSGVFSIRNRDYLLSGRRIRDTDNTSSIGTFCSTTLFSCIPTPRTPVSSTGPTTRVRGGVARPCTTPSTVSLQRRRLPTFSPGPPTSDSTTTTSRNRGTET